MQFIIPLRFEECEVPKRLAKWHWEDHFKENWYSRLMDLAITVRN
jgi:hypothetical protein